MLLLLSSCRMNEKHKESISEKIKSIDSEEVVAPKGNQLFEGSVKLQHLQIVHGYRLKSVLVQSCDDHLGEPNLDDDKRISAISIKENTFEIEFSVVENCCSDFLCEAEIVNESTLNILYHAFGTHCSCACKFEMKYSFTIEHDYLQEINKTPTKITHVQFNGNTDSRVAINRDK